MRKIHAAVVVLAVCVPFSGAYAATIVNGGFESGDLTGRTLSGATDFIGAGSFFPHAGAFALEAGPVGGLGFLSQAVTTVPGAPYSLSIWLANDCGSSSTCGQPNNFQVSWGNQVIYAASGLPALDYTQLLFSVTAVAATTNLTLGFRQDQFSFYVDDISLQAAPEPSGLALIGVTGLLAVGLRKRQRHGHLMPQKSLTVK